MKKTQKPVTEIFRSLLRKRVYFMLTIYFMGNAKSNFSLELNV